MGDRAAFGFRDDEGRTLWLYGHYAGDGMLETLADAVAHAQPRWDEPTYGTRMMISHMIGSDWDGEYGWGIGFDLPYCEHSVPVIDFASQEMWLYPYPGCDGVSDWALSQYPKYRIGFALFCKKYGSYATKEKFAYAQPKSEKTKIEEPRYTKAEWLQIMQDSIGP